MVIVGNPDQPAALIWINIVAHVMGIQFVEITKGELSMTEDTFLNLYWIGVVILAVAIWVGWGMAGMP